MLKKLVLYTCICLVLFLSSCQSSKQYPLYNQGEPGWTFLGRLKVNHVRDKDVLEVKNLGRYTALYIHVQDRDIKLRNMQITLLNGDVIKPALEKELKAGERSRIIEIAADGKQISHITFHYKTPGFILTKRATVDVVAKEYYPYQRY
jgi:hypothetical protein